MCVSYHLDNTVTPIPRWIFFPPVMVAAINRWLVITMRTILCALMEFQSQKAFGTFFVETVVVASTAERNSMFTVCLLAIPTPETVLLLLEVGSKRIRQVWCSVIYIVLL